MNVDRFTYRGAIVLLAAMLAGLAVVGCSSRDPRASSAAVEEPTRPAAAHGLSAFDAKEELWVIARHDEADEPRRPAPGASVAQLITQDRQRLELPVAHLRLHAAVAADHADIDVHQRFENPHEQAGEAVYRFVLPEEGRVRQFMMVIGERRIRGVIRERGEARSLYEAARRGGYRASLLNMDEPGVFSHRLSHLEAGQSLDVQLQYRQPTHGEAGRRELSLPAELVGAVEPVATDASPHISVALAAGLTMVELAAGDHTLAVPQGAAAARAEPRRINLEQPLGTENLRIRYQITDETLAYRSAGERRVGDSSGLSASQTFITIDARAPVAGE